MRLRQISVNVVPALVQGGIRARLQTRRVATRGRPATKMRRGAGAERPRAQPPLPPANSLGEGTDARAQAKRIYGGQTQGEREVPPMGRANRGYRYTLRGDTRFGE